MITSISSIDAYEILDSRGWPTLKVKVTLDGGDCDTASVPSGASTGRREAVEKRDGDPRRYAGRGVIGVASSVKARIEPHLLGKDALDQASVDHELIELDGTHNKSSLGANAILGVSMAVARAAAASQNLALYQYLGKDGAFRLPVPLINVINGGKHADNSLDFQEFMIVPHGATRFSEALRQAAETFHALGDLLRKQGFRTAVGDEGGFAPALRNNEEALELIVRAIQAAGYRPGPDIAIALDPAASSFYDDGGYALDKSGEGQITSEELFSRYRTLCDAYPIVSIEDGFAEDDWQGFERQTRELGNRIQIVGDDLYVTNPSLIMRGLEKQTTNAVLIKLNQIGTLSETEQAIALCRQAGWNWIISHRSGETEDAFIADYAVAMAGGQIKTGSVCRSERLAKYNRLLEIERELGAEAVFESPFRDRF